MNKDITLEDLGFSLDDSIVDELNYFSKKNISDTNVISFNTKYKTFQALIESDSPFTPPLPYTPLLLPIP